MAKQHWVFLSLASLAFMLGGAHFWRAGYPAFSAICAGLGLLVWLREAWLRPVLVAALVLLAGRWIWAAGQFVQLRVFMEQPWLRLACILLGVTAFTLAAALPLAGRTGEQRYTRKLSTATLQACAFGGTLAHTPHQGLHPMPQMRVHLPLCRHDRRKAHTKQPRRFLHPVSRLPRGLPPESPAPHRLWKRLFRRYTTAHRSNPAQCAAHGLLFTARM